MSGPPFRLRGRGGRPVLKSPCFLPCPGMAWPEPHRETIVMSEAHGGHKDEEKEFPGLPGGSQQMGPTHALALMAPSLASPPGRKTHLPSPPASALKGSRLLKTENASIIYTRCLLHRLFKSQGGSQAQGSLKQHEARAAGAGRRWGNPRAEEGPVSPRWKA